MSTLLSVARAEDLDAFVHLCGCFCAYLHALAARA